jgi:hypothetical protein
VQKLSILIVVALVAILAIGLSIALPYVFQKPGSTTSTNNSGSFNVLTFTSNQPPYDCALPAINSDLSCASLPAGYKIPPKLPGAPPVTCPTGMTAAACDLLQQTYGNGVCDPNETPFTAPLDCSCPGSLSPDPYTGRCTTPASVCQVIAALPDNPQYNSTSTSNP